MVHTFDAAKGKFVQKHPDQMPPRRASTLYKRHKHPNYVRWLISAEVGPQPDLTPEQRRQKEEAKDERKRQDEERAKQLSEKRKAAEEQRRNEAQELAARREQAKQKEQQKKAEEASKKEAEKKKRQEEEKRKAEEAEKKRHEDEKRKAEEAEKKRQERERKEAEAAAAAENKRLEEEAEKKRREEEAEKARFVAEAAEKKRIEEEAAERKRKEEEAEKKKREEEAEKARLEAEAAEKKRKEEEEAERKRQEEEAERKRQEEEVEKARLEAEAAEKKQIEELAERKREEEAEKKRQEEEAEKKRQEEEAEKTRLEAEAAEKKRIEKEEAERKRQEEETEKKRKEEEIEKARLEAEAAEKKMAEEEEAERKRVEEKKRLEKEAAERKRQEETEMVVHEQTRLPSEDKSQQRQKLVGAAQKVPRCGECTKPLDPEAQEKNRLMCTRCFEKFQEEKKQKQKDAQDKQDYFKQLPVDGLTFCSDAEGKGDKVLLSSDGCHCWIEDADAWQGVLLQDPTRGRPFEVPPGERGNFRIWVQDPSGPVKDRVFLIGWKAAEGGKRDELGEDEYSFAYVDAGEKGHAGASSEYGGPFTSGDEIIARCDRGDGGIRISYSKNGMDLGVAFDIPADEVPDELRDTPLQATICGQIFRVSLRPPISFDSKSSDAKAELAVGHEGLRLQPAKGSKSNDWVGARVQGLRVAPGEVGEFHIRVQAELLRVGWIVEGAACWGQLGTDSMGLSFGFGGTGKKAFSKEFDEYGEAFGVGDVITAVCDRRNGCLRISYIKNGNDLGEAFKFEKDEPDQMSSLPLYGAVCGTRSFIADLLLVSPFSQPQAAKESTELGRLKAPLVHTSTKDLRPPLHHEKSFSENVSAAASPLAHRDGQLPPPALMHIKREKGKTDMYECPLTRKSLDEGDCFILADGKTIYTWVGKESSPFEKNACAMHAENLARDRHGHVADPDSRFWELLGGDGTAGEDEAPEKEEIECEAKEEESAPEPVSYTGASAYRQYEAPAGPGGMRASAPEFLPGKGQWAVNLAKTNPDAVRARRANAPPISEASKRLPTYDRKDWILGTIRRNRVTVISGDTGCGKSTLIPQLIADAENLVPDDKVVVCTQPRRIAAITLAQYVSKDRGQDLGDEVGYQIRFVNAFSEHTRLIYATTAIILRRLHGEPTLDSIGCLIIDEVHERDVYTDFVLLLIRQAMLKGHMQHLKIVLMSATLKADDFADYFNDINGDALKPVSIPGRMFDVEQFYWEDVCSWLDYCPPLPRAGGKGKGKEREVKNPDDEDKWQIYEKIKACDIPDDRPGSERVDEYDEKVLTACWCWRESNVYTDLICDLVEYLLQELPKGEGAILIFLPGWGDIAKVFLQLYGLPHSLKLIALHSLMTPEQQQEAFERPPDGTTKIVLSTNIAEASVTIDDVVYVIDCGVRKERNFDPNSGNSALDTTMVTKANAIQRRGRAGRVQEGMAFHLFPSYHFNALSEFPVPQMLTSGMDEVVLQSKVICGGTNQAIERMLRGSMAAPEPVAIAQALETLKTMDCVTRREGELTALGRACAAIPVQPNVAKMLLLAAAFRCIKPAAVVAAFLSVKNPFQQSVGAKEQSRDKKTTGKDTFSKKYCSDHLAGLQAYAEWRREARKGRGDEFCDDHGISPETMDMAHMMVHQFVNFMVEANYDGKDVQDGNYGECDAVRRGSEEDALLRCALTAGFWPSACVLYRGQRSPYWWTAWNEEVMPFRGSVNGEYQMSGQDGDEWMVYSDAMRMGAPKQQIMDSTLVFSPFVLLFAHALLLDEKKGEVFFDRWKAKVDPKQSAWTELLDLRKKIMPAFKEALEGRDLSVFPPELTRRMADFAKQPPTSLRLERIDVCSQSIEEAASGQQRRNLSMFEWPVDVADEEPAEEVKDNWDDEGDKEEKPPPVPKKDDEVQLPSPSKGKGKGGGKDESFEATEKAVEQIVAKASGPIKASDFDNAALRFLAALRTEDEEKGSNRFQEAMDFVLRYAASKERSDVKRWSAWIYGLLSKVDPSLAEASKGSKGKGKGGGSPKGGAGGAPFGGASPEESSWRS